MKPFTDFPRFPLAALPTPLVRAGRLEARLGGPPLYVKRDDLSGFAAAGHKARQLEFLIGAALAEGCDVLVTGGGPRSNFCPAAAAAATAAGLECELVLYGTRPDRTHPNLAAALASGASVRFTGDPDRSAVDAAVHELAADLAAAGRRPYPIPRGGATAVGAIGMVLATDELAAQVDGLGIEPAAVVVATGSGGACAGIAVGTRAYQRTWEVVGASVSRPVDEAAAQVDDLAAACAALLDAPPPSRSPRLVDVRGDGFGVPSPQGDAAARVAFHTEGLLLDPVYTAKAFAVLLQLAEGDGPLVFWHTGGLLAAADDLARALHVGSPA